MTFAFDTRLRVLLRGLACVSLFFFWFWVASSALLNEEFGAAAGAWVVSVVRTSPRLLRIVKSGSNALPWSSTGGGVLASPEESTLFRGLQPS